MKTWFTADWHLGEVRFELMGRPFYSSNQHIDTLVHNHNMLVAPNDKVIMVGDVCYQITPQCLYHVTRFNGKKTLIRGNHDRVFTDEQLAPYFDTIIPEGKGIELEVDGIPCYITHYPTTGREDRFTICGHIHSIWKYQLNSFNVGVDVHHFRPVDAATIPFHFKAIAEFYDNDAWAAYSPINAKYKGIRGKKGTYFQNK